MNRNRSIERHDGASYKGSGTNIRSGAVPRASMQGREGKGREGNESEPLFCNQLWRRLWDSLSHLGVCLVALNLRRNRIAAGPRARERLRTRASATWSARRICVERIASATACGAQGKLSAPALIVRSAPRELLLANAVAVESCILLDN